MNYSFTGTRSLKPQHTRLILPVLEELTDGTDFYTGCARGVDTFVARALTLLYPQARHHLIVPAGPHNEELVDGWLPNDGNRFIHVMPPAASVPEAMRQRNAILVAKADRVVGFPLYEEARMPRSGTWQTIRMARKTHKMYRQMLLEPDDPHDRVPRVQPRQTRLHS